MYDGCNLHQHNYTYSPKCNCPSAIFTTAPTFSMPLFTPSNEPSSVVSLGLTVEAKDSTLHPCASKYTWEVTSSKPLVSLIPLEKVEEVPFRLLDSFVLLDLFGNRRDFSYSLLQFCVCFGATEVFEVHFPCILNFLIKLFVF